MDTGNHDASKTSNNEYGNSFHQTAVHSPSLATVADGNDSLRVKVQYKVVP
jgi:hypothetical protein